MVYSKGRLNPCAPRIGGATTWCTHYNGCRPEEGDCPHTCYFAVEQDKKLTKNKLEEEVEEEDFLM